ncbi:MAG: SPOR domain-containing protein [Sphingomonadales bacterium]|nr:SPOR domain-containing protein [Sphingomonadales bacterium]MBM3924065.1 SPOR domain-containing protein [Sphingomonadales bacterium]MBM3932433.1 SPOR domain-containing protein [Sphingomonadales bacterium]
MKNRISARFLSRGALGGPVLLLFLLLKYTGTVKACTLPLGQDLTCLVSDSGARVAPEQEKIPGFRVQVYQGPSRAKAKEIRDFMVQQYSKLGVYMGFRQPDFRVRIGDFRDKAEAQAYLQMLKSKYPAAFVVPDKVLLYPKAFEEGVPTLNQDGFED